MKGIVTLVVVLLSGCATLPANMRSPQLRDTCGMASPVPTGTLMTDARYRYDDTENPYREYAGLPDTKFYAVLPGTVMRAETGTYTSTIVVRGPHPSLKNFDMVVSYHFGTTKNDDGSVRSLEVPSSSTVVAGQYLGVLGQAPAFRGGPSVRIDMVASTCDAKNRCTEKRENPGALLTQAATCEQGAVKIAETKPAAPKAKKKASAALAKVTRPKRPAAPRRR